jgi:hypothetical protein
VQRSRLFIAAPKICAQYRRAHICPYGNDKDQDRIQVRIQEVSEPETSAQYGTRWHDVKATSHHRRRQEKAHQDRHAIDH